MLFKILKGDSSRISLDITPFHDGWCYFTSDDGKLYIDSDDGGVQKRTCINPNSNGKSKAVYVTLKSSAWNNKEQKVPVEGLTKDQNGTMGLIHDVSVSELEAAKGAELYVCHQEDGALTVAVYGDTPQIDIPAVVILMP